MFAESTFFSKFSQENVHVALNGSTKVLGAQIMCGIDSPYQKTQVQVTHLPYLNNNQEFNFFSKNSHGQKRVWPPGFSSRAGTITLIGDLHGTQYNNRNTFVLFVLTDESYNELIQTRCIQTRCIIQGACSAGCCLSSNSENFSGQLGSDVIIFMPFPFAGVMLGIMSMT